MSLDRSLRHRPHPGFYTHGARFQGLLRHTHLSMIGFAVRLLGMIALLGVTALVAGCTGGDDRAVSTTTTEVTTLSVPEVVVLVRSRAKEVRPVQRVLCHAFSDDLTLCAVTFRGPSCELWEVDNGKAFGLGVIVKGASGSRSAKGVRCG